MRPVINMTLLSDYIHTIHDFKEAIWGFIPQFRATKSNVFLRSTRALLRAVNCTKTADTTSPTWWEYKTRTYVTNPNYRSPLVSRIHKAFGRGWLRIEFDVGRDGIAMEKTVRVFIQDDETAPRNQEELRLNYRELKAMYYLAAGKLKDYHERTDKNPII